MAATIVTIADAALNIDNDPRSNSEFEFESSQQSSELSNVTNTTIDTRPSDDQTLQSQSSQNSTKSSNSSLPPIEITKNNQNVNKKAKKYRNFLHSDSDEDDVVQEPINKNSCDNGSVDASQPTQVETSKLSDVKKKIKKFKKYRNFLYSDSDDSEGEKGNFIKSMSNTNGCGDVQPGAENLSQDIRKEMSQFVSEQEEISGETEETAIAMETVNDSDDDDIGTMAIKKPRKSKISMIIDSDSEDENITKNSENLQTISRSEQTSSKTESTKSRISEKSRFRTLVDTDSEDEVIPVNDERSPEKNEEDGEGIGKKNEKSGKTKRPVVQRASKDEAMRQIHSETQRLIRSAEVSLPYHRPKQRTLQDFLNRKKFIPALPEGLTTAAKVKMSSMIVGKVLEEKEKEAELFYKSSDSEDEITCTPQNSTEDPTSGPPIDEICIEETQKIFKNDIQNAHNKKEIIKQGAADLGVPRKLFVDEIIDMTLTGNPESTEHTSIDDEDLNSIDPKKRIKETKPGLREVVVPRKLFSSDYVDAVELSLLSSQNSGLSEFGEAQPPQSKTTDPSPEKEKLENPSCPKFTPEIPEAPTVSKISKETVEPGNISETPFISKDELAKCLNRIDPKQFPNENSPSKNENSTNSIEPTSNHVFGLPPPVIILSTDVPIVKKKPITPTLNNRPKLRGTPGMIIDFSDNQKPNKLGVQSLVDRFMRHATVAKPIESTTPVMVLHTEKTADGIKITEQALPYKIPTTDIFNDKDLSKPGAKHERLKNELMKKMATKRNEEWKLKEQQEKEENEDIEEECYSDDDGKLYDEEEEGDTESEPEEEDMPRSDKKKRKHRKFADEEAEVSGEDSGDEDDEEAIEVSDYEKDEDKEDEGIKTTINLDEDTCDTISSEDEDTSNKNKRPSRIAKAFEDDSNSSPETPSLNDTLEIGGTVLARTKTDVDIFAPDDVNDAWLSDVESELPPSQFLGHDRAKTPSLSTNPTRFLSPITPLTNFNFTTESPKDYLASSLTPFTIESTEKTPVATYSPMSCESVSRIGFQKKLFHEPGTPVKDTDLMDLCSGRFTGLENEDRVASSLKITETQVLGVCSSSFSSHVDDTLVENKSFVDETSQDLQLTLDEDSRDTCNDTTVKETVTWSTLKCVSSSDEEDSTMGTKEGRKKKKLTKRGKVKQLVLSDEEDEEPEFPDEDEDEDDEVVDTGDDDKYLDYDSEENEIVVVPKKDIKKVAAGFLDAEAELSESEWGSADEDEKDMDKLEIEEGDNEEIDEDNMRDQLGKMHMRQVLDDDQREVRMLQELLFDDGDLHTDGSGRERKFKWKNLDSLGEDYLLGPRPEDGDENVDENEGENDLEWRKERLEREKFIESFEKGILTEDVNEKLASDSQMFSLGLKALKKSKSSLSSQEPEPTVKPKLSEVPTGVQKSQTLLVKSVKRGSFLARGDEALARLAVHIKHTDKLITTHKNPRNFVFAHISPSVEGITDDVQEEETTTKENSSTPSQSRKRKPPAGITPRTTKKAKMDVARSSAKKLF